MSPAIAFVINIFEPLSMYSSPSKTAVVCWPDASVPALGSVRPNAPNFSPLASGLKNFVLFFITILIYRP